MATTSFLYHTLGLPRDIATFARSTRVGTVVHHVQLCCKRDAAEGATPDGIT
jgi:hypothetical protein